MIYNLNEKFTKIEEVKGVLENKCRHTSIELVVTEGVPEKDSGIELQPKEKMPFRIEKKQSLYARCTSLDGIMANLAVVNFNVPASEESEAGKMVGAILYGHTILDGCVMANGTLLIREEYPDLFQYAQNNNLLLAESVWVDGMQGMYSVGNGSTTFRIPDLRGEFLRGLDNGRGVDAGRVIGSIQGDAIKSHTSKVGTGWALDSFDPTGGAYIVSADVSGYSYGSFNATYSGAAETRPCNVALIAQIKY